MISFEQARQIALDRVGPIWEPGGCGEYVVAAYGYEDASAWCLVDGGRRLVIDGDSGCEPIGRGCTFVDKESGEIFLLTYLEDPGRFDSMTKVGQHPADADAGITV
jgi:hypothetical protein